MRLFACFALLASFAMTPSGLSAAEPLHAGAVTVDITPPAGFRMSGYFTERLNTGTRDPLLAKALVLAQGDERCAIVVCDLIGMSEAVSRDARDRAAAKTGIPADKIVIAATHSHTGPLYWGVLRDFFHAASVKQHGKDPTETIDYPQWLADTLVAAIEKADQAKVPVTLEAGAVEQRGLSFNRRFHMRDGSVRFNPGIGNKDIVRVAGPIDPEVGLALFRNAETKQPLSALTVFALHLDTLGGTQYSADYPRYLQTQLTAALGKDFVSVFGLGTCGDINHINVAGDPPRAGGVETEHIGTTLGNTVATAIPTLKQQEQPNLAVLSTKVTVPLKQFTEQQVAQAKQDLSRVGKQQLPFLEEVLACTIVAVSELKGTVDLEVQVFRLSDDVAIVGLPGEVFVELGAAIKSGSPFRHTLVMELCNDTPHYIPTRKAFAEGSYETVNAIIEPGGAEVMVGAAVDLLNQLKPVQE